jgi:hypothetical protein
VFTNCPNVVDPFDFHSVQLDSSQLDAGCTFVIDAEGSAPLGQGAIIDHRALG